MGQTVSVDQLKIGHYVVLPGSSVGKIDPFLFSSFHCIER